MKTTIAEGRIIVHVRLDFDSVRLLDLDDLGHLFSQLCQPFGALLV